MLFLAAGVARAQTLLDYTLDGTEQGKPLSVVLRSIEQKQPSRFFFVDEWINALVISQRYDGKTLAFMLDDLFNGTDLNYILMYNQILVIVKDPTQALLRKNVIEQAVRQNKTIEAIKFGDPLQSNRSEKIMLSGLVIDSKTGEPLPGTNIQVNDKPVAVTNAAGQYSLELSPGSHAILFSYVNFESKLLDVSAFASGVLNLELEKVPTVLDEVVIQAQATPELTTTRIGEIQLTMRELKRSPTFLGEVDIIKQVQNLPGVTTVGEAATGFNVRGGSVDQNLILYDGLPVFNSAHVFGFFSAFNSEAIRDVSFHRGGIPAEYGGRVSSVLNIQSRDGDFSKWNGKAGIGLVTSNIMVNGPLQKDKTSMAASFRTTYSNWLVRSIRTDYADLRKSQVSFYDGTLKLTHILDNDTRVSFTGYASKDGFRLKGDSTYQWQTVQGSMRVDRTFSPSLTGEFIAGVTSYGYTVVNSNQRTASELSYRITSTVAKAGFNYNRGKHKYNFGWNFTHYVFDPGRLIPTNETSNAKRFALDKQFSIENAFYAADEWMIKEKLFIEGGVRLPMFLSFGRATINTYREGVPREVVSIIDTVQYGRGEVIKAYAGLEPRLSARWTTGEMSSVKLGYNRMYQYLHLVTNSTAVTPVDIWQPSGYYFKPQRADQISLGYFKDWPNKKYGASIEGFYKYLKNIIDFKDGASLILNRNLETDLLQGNGYSYGIESYLSKNTGRFTGSVNYTYSRTFRIISGPTEIESINLGKRYPANFDQPHIFNLSWKYNLSRRHYFTGNFTYHTGRPVTIPLSAFVLENTTVAFFSARNQYRIPDYHRLDIALVIEGNHKRKKSGEGSWAFSLYNVYARRNPYTIFFRSDGGGVPKPYQLSIIGTILPSITYNFKF